MGLTHSVTQYQTESFSQGKILSNHLSRATQTAGAAIQAYKDTPSEAAKELAVSLATTVKSINDVSKGVCAALCIKWIKMVAAAKSERMLRISNPIPFAKAVLRQNAARSLGLQQEQLSQLYNLKAKKKEIAFSRGLNLIVDDMLSNPGLFYLLSFNTKENSHVIAISIGYSKHPELFDPNFGEFALPRSKLSVFLSELLEQGYEVGSKAINGVSEWDFSYHA